MLGTAVRWSSCGPFSRRCMQRLQANLAATHIGYKYRSISDPDIPCTIMLSIAEARNASAWISAQSLLSRFICSPVYSQTVTLLLNQENTLPMEWPRWLTTESMVQSLPSNITRIQSVMKFPSFMKSEVSITHVWNNDSVYPETDKSSLHLYT